MSNIVHGPLRTTLPFTRINDDIVLRPDQFELLLDNQTTFLNQSQRHSEIPTASNRLGPKFATPFLQKAFVNVVTETVGDYPYPYFSEKTWASMVSGVPFMLIGSQYSIRTLKEFGFQTFDQWWSEEYDELPTVADRIESLVAELKKLCLLDSNNLRLIQHQMKDVIVHNQNHLCAFEKNDLDNVRKKVYNTV